MTLDTESRLDVEPTTSAETPQPLSSERSVPRSRPVRLSLVTLVLVTGLWRMSVMVSWSWFQDDFPLMSRAAVSGFSQYTWQIYNGHLMPAEFALFWLSANKAPLQYGWAVAVNWSLGMAALVMWVVALRRLVGERAVLLPAVALLGLAPVWMTSTWWVTVSPMTWSFQLSLAAAVWFAARWSDGGRTRDLAGLAFALLFGLAFWEKAVLLVIPVFGLLAFQLNASSRPFRSRTLIAPAAVLGTIVVVYSAVYLRLSASSPELGPRLVGRSVAQVWDFYKTGLLVSALPSMFGGPWSGAVSLGAQFGAPSTLQSWLVSLAVVAVVVAGLVYRRGAEWLVLTGASFTAISWGLVLLSQRYDVLGPLTMYDSRYINDSVSVLVLCGTLLVTPLVGEAGPWRQPLPNGIGRYEPVVGGIAGVVLTVSCLYGSSAVWDAAAPLSPRPYVDTMLSSVARAHGASVFDAVVPAAVAVGWTFPQGPSVSDLTAPLHAPVRWNAPAARMYTIDEQGRLADASITPNVTAEAGPIAQCGYLVLPGRTSVVPLTGALFPYQWGVTLSYLSRDGATLTVTSDADRFTVPLSPGIGTRTAVVGGAVSSLRLSTSAGSGAVCVDTVKVGLVVPGPLVPAGQLVVRATGS